MGAKQSNLPLMPDGFEYFSLTFRYGDRIRLIYGTYIDIDAVRKTILQHWQRGIKQEANHLGPGFEFIIKGSPFCQYSTGDDNIYTRKLANQLLLRLQNQGCKLIASSLLSRTQDLTTWLFHREQVPHAQYQFACIGISDDNKLELVDFPAAMCDVIQGEVEKHWIVKKWRMVAGALELKLKGKTWASTDTEENVKSKTLIKSLIDELDSRQWLLHGSSNLRGQSDTLFFRYDPYAPAGRSRLAGFCIHFYSSDRLRMIDAPDNAVDCVKSTILECWKQGIQQQKQKFNAYEFKLGGTPWRSHGKKTLQVRYLLCKMFEALISFGFKAQMAIHLTRLPTEKCMVTFQRCQATSAQIFCLSLNGTDKIHIINAPACLKEALVAEVKKIWSFGIGNENVVDESYELKLNGCPWADDHDGPMVECCCHIWSMFVAGWVGTSSYLQMLHH